MSEILVSSFGVRYLVSPDHAPYEIVRLDEIFGSSLTRSLFLKEMRERTRLEAFDRFFPFHKALLFSKNLFAHLGLVSTEDGTPCCYVLSCVNTGQFYVGSTKNVCTRMYQHRMHMKDNRHYLPEFNEAYREFGECSFQVLVIYCESREDAYEVEQQVVDAFRDDERLLNSGKDNVRYPQQGRAVSPIHREKLVASNRQRWADPVLRQRHSEQRKQLYEDRPELRQAQKERMLMRFSDPEERSKQAERTRLSFERGDRRAQKAQQTRQAFADPEIRQKYIDAARERTGSKQLSIEGVLYEGYNDASRRLGLQAALIRYRVLSPKPQWSEWRFA